MELGHLTAGLDGVRAADGWLGWSSGSAWLAWMELGQLTACLARPDQLRLLMPACETGGRSSKACVSITRLLAKARARSAPAILRFSAEQGWAAQWWSLLSIAAHDALAETLLEDSLATLAGSDGPSPPPPDLFLDTILPPSFL